MQRRFAPGLVLALLVYAAGAPVGDCFNDEDGQKQGEGGRANDLETPAPEALPDSLRITAADVRWLLDALQAARENSATTAAQP